MNDNKATARKKKNKGQRDLAGTRVRILKAEAKADPLHAKLTDLELWKGFLAEILTRTIV